MKTLEIISIDKFKYTLKDLEKEYILNIEFAGYNPVVHDKIIMHEELLNILYLIKYGVKNIDKIVYDSLEDLTISHNEYIKKIKDYEKKYSKEEVIMLLDNV